MPPSHRSVRTRAALVATMGLALAASLLLRPPGAHGQPEIKSMSPEDGAVLAEPPPVIHMCFGSPINIRDVEKGGDFHFFVERPDGRGIGLRIVFQPDGFGADIYPGIHGEKIEGTWTFDWRVTDAETQEPAEGTATFQVAAGGSPVLEKPAAPCPAVTPEASASPTPGQPLPGDEQGNDHDTLIVALIAGGAAATVAILGLLLYVLRLRIRSWLRRRPPGGGPEGSGGD
jgi:methionine-rich copper-binding protein CopC